MQINTPPPIYRLLTVITLTVLVIGVVFYHYVEHFTWVDSIYFCVVTLATVGYGDIVPKTDPGKIFTVFYILIGVGILSAFIRSFLVRAQDRREKKEREKLKH